MTADAVSLTVRAQTGEQTLLYRESHALLIGAGDYQNGWSKLTNVVEETRALGTELRKHGFEIRTIMDPTGRQLRDAVESFIADFGYDPDTRILFFFSGHGHTRGDKGYIVPVDAPDPTINETGFLRTAVPMLEVMTWARRMEVRHAIFIFDSCFSGTIFESKSLPPKPPARYVLQSATRPVRQFITAGEAGQEVPAKSVFLPLLLRALEGGAANNDDYITGVELGLYLAQEVSQYDARLSPQYGKIRDPELDEGDFIFRVPGADVPAQPAPDPGTPKEVEDPPPPPPAALPPPPPPAPRRIFEVSGTWFDAGKGLITPEGSRRLDQVVGIMRADPALSVTVEGHTDSVGYDSANQQMSERRADAVRDYLVANGVHASRITTRGFGETRPVASNDTPEGRAQNRRVEVVTR